MAGSRLKDGDREALERSGSSERCCLLGSLDGEVVGSLALQLASCGVEQVREAKKGSGKTHLMCRAVSPLQSQVNRLRGARTCSGHEVTEARF